MGTAVIVPTGDDVNMTVTRPGLHVTVWLLQLPDGVRGTRGRNGAAMMQFGSFILMSNVHPAAVL